MFGEVQKNVEEVQGRHDLRYYQVNKLHEQFHNKEHLDWDVSPSDKSPINSKNSDKEKTYILSSIREHISNLNCTFGIFSISRQTLGYGFHLHITIFRLIS